MDTNFHKLCDKICSELSYGILWHSAAVLEFNKIALRGFARWNSREAEGDLKSKLCFEKLLCDKLDFMPTITINAPKLHWESLKNLPEILKHWEQREYDFANEITQAMVAARDMDIAVYKCLMCLADEVQEEAFRLRLVMKRFENTDYYHHDVMRSSLDLHRHFSDTDSLNFDI